MGRLSVVAAVVAVCAVGVGVASHSAAAGRPAQQPTAALQARVQSPAGAAAAAPPNAAVDSGRDPGSLTGWTGVIAALYSRRAAAFTAPTADGGAHGLAGVYAPGSPQRAADETQIRALARDDEMLRGFAPTIAEVTRASVTGDRVELLLTDTWPRYDVVPAGQGKAMPLRTGPARPPTKVRMVLVRTAVGWRIAGAERLT